MAYTKYSWQNGESVTAYKMNALEDRIVTAPGIYTISATIELQGGELNASDGNLEHYFDTANWYLAFSQPNYLRFNPLTDDITGATLLTNETLYTYCYSIPGAFLGRIAGYDKSSMPSGTNYIKFMVVNTSAYTSGRLLSMTLTYSAPQLSFVFNVGKKALLSTNFYTYEAKTPPKGTDNTSATSEYSDNHTRRCDNGYIILPPNYTPDGDPVPLVMYIHGTSGFYWTNTEVQNYQKYLQFVAKNGYAVADCYLMTDLYKTDTIGEGAGICTDAKCTPMAACNYANFYNFLMRNFNLRTTGCYVFGKSAGGLMATMLGYLQLFPVRAVGNLAPSLTSWGADCRYLHKAWINWQLDQFGCESPNVTGSLADDASKQYVLDNVDKLIGWDPMVYCSNIKLKDMLTKMYAISNIHNYGTDEELVALMESGVKFQPFPMKIWQAVDDEAVPIATSRFYVKMVQNGGGICYLREFPAGTGKHHAVDNSSSAPQVSYITRYSGTVTICQAYAELVDWFNRW